MVSLTEKGNFDGDGELQGEGTEVNTYEVADNGLPVRADGLVSHTLTGTFVDGELQEGTVVRKYEGRDEKMVSLTEKGNFDGDGELQGEGTEVNTYEVADNGLPVRADGLVSNTLTGTFVDGELQEGTVVRKYEGRDEKMVSLTEKGNFDGDGELQGEGTEVNTYEVADNGLPVRADGLVSHTLTGTFVDGELQEGTVVRKYEGRDEKMVSLTEKGNFDGDGELQGEGTEVNTYEVADNGLPVRADGLVSKTYTGTFVDGVLHRHGTFIRKYSGGKTKYMSGTFNQGQFTENILSALKNVLLTIPKRLYFSLKRNRRVAPL
jgi:predicted transcriptional regulator